MGDRPQTRQSADNPQTGAESKCRSELKAIVRIRPFQTVNSINEGSDHKNVQLALLKLQAQSAQWLAQFAFQTNFLSGNIGT